MTDGSTSEPKKMAIVVAEGSFDKAMMPLILATTGASMGMEVHVFFTFWGLNLLKKNANPKLPGLFRLMTGWFRKRMAKIGLEGFRSQREMAIDLGVNMYACSTTMNIMDIQKEQLVDGVKVLGAAAFLNIAAESDIQLFIG